GSRRRVEAVASGPRRPDPKRRARGWTNNAAGRHWKWGARNRASRLSSCTTTDKNFSSGAAARNFTSASATRRITRRRWRFWKANNSVVQAQGSGGISVTVQEATGAGGSRVHL